jgi:hypothetical protein
MTVHSALSAPATVPYHAVIDARSADPTALAAEHLALQHSNLRLRRNPINLALRAHSTRQHQGTLAEVHLHPGRQRCPDADSRSALQHCMAPSDLAPGARA